MTNEQGALGVLSVFLTIDGECNEFGPGIWSTFVRFRGCSVGCVWCDTKYSWPNRGGAVLTPAALVSEVRAVSMGCTKVTITGGEPLEQNWDALGAFIHQLRVVGRIDAITIETSGTYDVELFRAQQRLGYDTNVSFIVDWKLSSACAKPNQPTSMYARLRARDRIKFVVASKADFEEAYSTALQIRRLGNTRTAIYFSPVHEKVPPTLLLHWMRDAGCQTVDVRLNLQMHKVIWPADVRAEEDGGTDFTKRTLGRSEYLERAHTPDKNL
jgi:7-carboxy-7-deazaguanine synthase